MKNASGMRTFLIIMLAISGALAALAILAPVSVELGALYVAYTGPYSDDRADHLYGAFGLWLGLVAWL
jgi:hypothetical protein